MTFSAMAGLSLLVVMPASVACDQVGRRWTIIPTCLSMAAALSFMAVSGQLLCCNQMTSDSSPVVKHSVQAVPEKNREYHEQCAQEP